MILVENVENSIVVLINNRVFFSLKNKNGGVINENQSWWIISY